jgi:hypothetical protein
LVSASLANKAVWYRRHLADKAVWYRRTLPIEPFGIGAPRRLSRLVTAHLTEKIKKREDRAHGARGLALSLFFGRPFDHAQRSVAEVGDLFGRKKTRTGQHSHAIS